MPINVVFKSVEKSLRKNSPPRRRVNVVQGPHRSPWSISPSLLTPPPPSLRPTGHNIDTEQMIYLLNSTWRISFWLNVSVTLRNTCSCCFHSEYIKVIDGYGTTVISRYGSSSTIQKAFREVSFGNSGNITVELYLRRSYSNFKLQFGILKQGFQSGKPRTPFNRR